MDAVLANYSLMGSEGPGYYNPLASHLLLLCLSVAETGWSWRGQRSQGNTGHEGSFPRHRVGWIEVSSEHSWTAVQGVSCTSKFFPKYGLHCLDRITSGTSFRIRVLGSDPDLLNQNGYLRNLYFQELPSDAANSHDLLRSILKRLFEWCRREGWPRISGKYRIMGILSLVIS